MIFIFTIGEGLRWKWFTVTVHIILGGCIFLRGFSLMAVYGMAFAFSAFPMSLSICLLSLWTGSCRMPYFLVMIRVRI